LASIVLGVMILPTFVAISREVHSVVPRPRGSEPFARATRWQVIREVVLHGQDRPVSRHVSGPRASDR